jgi:hypothetical protein
MSKVVHCRKEPYDVYIGRGKNSKWGNPFTHIKDKKTLAKFIVSDREEAIKKYEEWIRQSPLISQIEELRGKTLGCWCKPKSCHGDVLLKLLKESSQQKIV